MKKLLGIILIIFTIIGLSACGKVEDMSGTYFFKRTLTPPDHMQSEDVGRLTLEKASEDGMEYNAVELVPSYGIHRRGKLVLNDKSYLDLTLDDSEEDPDYDYDGDLMPIDITNLSGVEYDFQKGVLTLGGELEFYREDTEEGMKLMKIRTGAASQAESEEAGESEEASIPTGEELYMNSCASCHGNDLSGPMAPPLTNIGADLSEDEILDIIQNGKGVMPARTAEGEDAKAIAAWLSDFN